MWKIMALAAPSELHITLLVPISSKIDTQIRNTSTAMQEKWSFVIKCILKSQYACILFYMIYCFSLAMARQKWMAASLSILSHHPRKGFHPITALQPSGRDQNFETSQQLQKWGANSAVTPHMQELKTIMENVRERKRETSPCVILLQSGLLVIHNNLTWGSFHIQLHFLHIYVSATMTFLGKENILHHRNPSFLYMDSWMHLFTYLSFKEVIDGQIQISMVVNHFTINPDLL